MITLDLHTGFSVIACLMSLAALGGVFWLYRAMELWRARCLALEAALPSLRHEVERVASLHAQTGRQVEKIAHEYLDVQDRVDLVEQQRGSGRAVGDAVDEARRGADVGKLTQQFGLSRGEAELVNRLHGQRRSA